MTNRVTRMLTVGTLCLIALTIFNTSIRAQSNESKVGRSSAERSNTELSSVEPSNTERTGAERPGAEGSSVSATKSEPPGGVGLLITSDKPAHYVVQYVLPEMSAARANIAVGDVVSAVGDVPVESVKNLDELVAKIRGTVGSSVKLTISSGGKTRNVILTRSLIPSKKQVVDVDYGREKAVWFYQREDIVPSEMTERTGMYGDRCVRDFLRQGIGR